jgi:hypothetical protein
MFWYVILIAFLGALCMLLSDLRVARVQLAQAKEELRKLKERSKE